MKEQLITFETTNLAKEKGFNIPCNFYIYTPKNLELLNKNRESVTGNKNTFKENHIFTQRNKYHKGREVDRNKYSTTISVPSQSLLQKWLREVHKIDVVRISPLNVYSFYLAKHNKIHEVNGEILFLFGDTYEEALEKGLQEALSLI
tara:strand:- start:542 stop:982 length:441 start_codon:yes stop_codon:yes gene_type:complete